MVGKKEGCRTLFSILLYIIVILIILIIVILPLLILTLFILIFFLMLIFLLLLLLFLFLFLFLICLIWLTCSSQIQRRQRHFEEVNRTELTQLEPRKIIEGKLGKDIQIKTKKWLFLFLIYVIKYYMEYHSQLCIAYKVRTSRVVGI